MPYLDNNTQMDILATQGHLCLPSAAAMMNRTQISLHVSSNSDSRYAVSLRENNAGFGDASLHTWINESDTSLGVSDV